MQVRQDRIQNQTGRNGGFWMGKELSRRCECLRLPSGALYLHGERFPDRHIVVNDEYDWRCAGRQDFTSRYWPRSWGNESSHLSRMRDSGGARGSNTARDYLMLIDYFGRIAKNKCSI